MRRLVVFDDQSNMKIKTAGPATIALGGKVKSAGTSGVANGGRRGATRTWAEPELLKIPYLPSEPELGVFVVISCLK
jgi:hypothetical protein